MSDREDSKLREVAVASYRYRHEAEFAAGFLDHAGIPYRLQIDDAALGISMSTPATIWVAAMDERRARAILENELAVESDEDDVSHAGERAEDRGSGAGGAVGRASGQGGPWSASREADDEEGRTAARTVPPAGGTPPSRQPPRTPRRQTDKTRINHGKPQPDLTLRQRVVSLGGSVAVASSLGVEAVRDAGPAVTAGIAVLGAGLALVAVIGRAPAFLERVLGALSGDAP